nr:unnamed protein product [Callosobruchus analis]
MELIRDVANQLDIDILCYKILRNVSRLTHAERGSLFLARQRGEERYLVAKLFNVQHDATFEEAVRQSEEFRIPFGMGIAGAVALNKTIVNIKDACRWPLKLHELIAEIENTDNSDDEALISDGIAVSPPLNASGYNTDEDSSDESQESTITADAEVIFNKNIDSTILEQGGTSDSYGDDDLPLSYFVPNGVPNKKAKISIKKVPKPDYKWKEQTNIVASFPGWGQKYEPTIVKFLSTVRRSMYWENSDDAGNKLVCLAARFNFLTQNLHLNDNSNLEQTEKFQKMRPLFSVLNKKFQLFAFVYLFASDARFNSEIDMRLDYRTNAVLCMPICNYEGDVIGVAQIVNKRPAGEFDAHDAELFQRYLTFCGIGVQNAQLFEVSVLEYKRNQILLNLARSIFEEQNNLECLVSKIMREAQDLLKCERCAVYLLDLDCCEAIAGYAACTGQILNIGDVRAWLKEQHSEGDAESARTILCMPIINGQRTIIGVAQLINKENQAPFTECDVSLFEAFAIFCGLGIHNTQMYENACKLMAKQKATEKLIKEHIPSAQTYNLYSFTFVDFDLSDMDTCKATVRMFLECSLVQQFHIPYEVLCRWILSVKKNYRPVKYHNWRHALNVAQTMFAMFKTGKMERFMSDLEILGLLVACLCHDLDHRGTNNAFQMKTDSPLAVLYSTSTMEHHHFDQCVMILNTDTNNIFQALSPDDYRTVMKMVENAILSTDLAMYFKKKNKFLELIDNGEFDWQSEDKKELLSGMMMTACDVSAIAKPWEVQHKIAKLAMMDRERKDELPQMQVGFIDVICLPLYRVLSDTFPWMRPLYMGTLENRKHWQDLAEKVEMGLTWIDHDTIDKPVEAFRVSNAPRVDIKKRTKHKICCML